MSGEISDKDFTKMKRDFVHNNVPLCDNCGFMGNCKFESRKDPCPLLVKSVNFFFDRYRRNIYDWKDEKKVETLEKAARAYMESLWTQLHYMIGMSINQQFIAFHGGDTEKQKSKSKKFFETDSWAAKFNILQLGRLVKLLREIHSDDPLTNAVILEDDYAMNISIEKPSVFEEYT